MPTRSAAIDLEPVFEPTPEAAVRLRRLRWMAWVLDRSIPIGGGRRIGLDPLIGLVPGVGDWLGAALSCWLVYEAVLLGLPTRVLLRMGGNILIEAAVGVVPVLGDVFDAAWQANRRNLQLIERHYDPRRRPRSVRGVLIAFLVVTAVFLVALAALGIWLLGVVWSWIDGVLLS